MAILTLIYEKVIRFAPIAKVLLIPCVISLILGIVFYAYDRQPYGNMSILPAVKQDMSTIQIVTKCKLSEQGNTATAYAQVEQGNFEQYVPFQPEDTLYVNSCECSPAN